MNHPRYRESLAGLTLIEVAVAIALLGLVVAAAVTATGSGLQAWIAARDTAALNRRDGNWNDQFLAAVAAMIPMAALAESASSPVQVFFQGTPRGMRFVTGHAPSGRGRGGIRLVEVRSERAAGRAALVLRDGPCPDAVTLGALLDAPMNASSHAQPSQAAAPGSGRAWSRVVADDLAECRFRYLADPARPGESGKWVSLWVDREAVPRAVRIEWKPRTDGHSSSITAAVMVGSRGLRNSPAWYRERGTDQ